MFVVVVADVVVADIVAASVVIVAGVAVWLLTFLAVGACFDGAEIPRTC